MIRKRALVIFLLLAIAYPATVLAQREATSSTASPPPPLLTLEDAVSLALSNNRLVKNSVLETQKFDFRVSTVRSRRLPQFQFAALGGELMHSFDFTFD